MRSREFRWVSGEELVAAHPRTTDLLSHFFCGRCGSSLVTGPANAFDEPGRDVNIGIHLGALERIPD